MLSCSCRAGPPNKFACVPMNPGWTGSCRRLWIPVSGGKKPSMKPRATLKCMWRHQPSQWLYSRAGSAYLGAFSCAVLYPYHPKRDHRRFAIPVDAKYGQRYHWLQICPEILSRPIDVSRYGLHLCGVEEYPGLLGWQWSSFTTGPMLHLAYRPCC